MNGMCPAQEDLDRLAEAVPFLRTLLDDLDRFLVQQSSDGRTGR